MIQMKVEWTKTSRLGQCIHNFNRNKITNCNLSITCARINFCLLLFRRLYKFMIDLGNERELKHAYILLYIYIYKVIIFKIQLFFLIYVIL